MEYAAQQGDIYTLYSLIDHNPRVLEEIDSIPFVETPCMLLHMQGMLNFAMRSSFSWKFNSQGLRSVHLALQHECSRMDFHLIQMDKELVRAKMRRALTLLHLESQSGYINLLRFENLTAFNDDDVDVVNELALVRLEQIDGRMDYVLSMQRRLPQHEE
ncbi:hypothetical protein VNO80_25731 [Phaseolus coccineus]|uniref:Uncharacterized protein n=1 Tax=Phaseolus coccineus TaxID=3886 RepID=A0AAN9LUQ2_PHACN